MHLWSSPALKSGQTRDLFCVIASKYCQKTGILARLVLVNMTSNSITITDPQDAVSLDVVGFLINTPTAISNFIAGHFCKGEGGMEK
jgi:hypothetical protein